MSCWSCERALLHAVIQEPRKMDMISRIFLEEEETSSKQTENRLRGERHTWLSVTLVQKSQASLMFVFSS